MKILWVHNFNIDAGAGNFMFPLLDAIRNDAAVDLLNLGSLRNLENIIKKVRELRRMQIDYDIVHAQYGSLCAFLCSVVVPKNKLVITLRGNDFNLHHSMRSWLFLHTRIARQFSVFALRRCRTFTAPSKRMLVDVQKLSALKSAKGYYFPSPVEYEFWAQVSATERDKNYFVFVNQREFDPIKGETIVKAVSRALQDQAIDVRIETLRGQSTSRLRSAFRMANAIVLMSETEGWPNCIKEAMACGTPFISTDVSDLREISDIVPECKIVERSSSALLEAILNSRTEIVSSDSSSALTAMSKNFSSKHGAATLLQIYRDNHVWD